MSLSFPLNDHIQVSTNEAMNSTCGMILADGICHNLITRETQILVRLDNKSKRVMEPSY